MSLRPHLHLLIPSSTPSILLETRVYLPPSAPSAPSAPSSSTSASASTTSAASLGLGTSSRSKPVPVSQLGAELRASLTLVGKNIDQIVIAAHPWSKLGGNMLFPVISHFVVPATLDAGSSTACVTYNVRGIGASGGSSSWFGVGSDPADFAAVERGVVDLLWPEQGESMNSGRRLYRLGYSYGSLLATLAPPPPAGYTISSTLLISPPLTLFRAFTLFSGGYVSALRSLLAPATKDSPAVFAGATSRLWIVYGTADDFTGASSYRSLVADLLGSNSGIASAAETDIPAADAGVGSTKAVRAVEVDGAAHFYVRDEDGWALRRAITEWVSGELGDGQGQGKRSER